MVDLFVALAAFEAEQYVYMLIHLFNNAWFIDANKRPR